MYIKRFNTRCPKFWTHGLGGRKAGYFILFALLWSLSSAEMRVWTDRAGNSFEAEYVREIFGTVMFKTEDRRSRAVDVEDLSANDVEYLRTMVPPEVEIGFSKRTQKKERSLFARADDEILTVTGTVHLKKKSKASFRGKLRLELCLVGQEIATPDYVLLGKKTFSVEFSDEKKNACECELPVKVRRYREYNNQIRGAEYLGYVAVLLGPQKNIIQVETDLAWLREEDIELFRELKENSFFDENCWEMPVPRPDYYAERTRF